MSNSITFTYQTPPTSEAELLQRAKQLAGLSFGEIALNLNLTVPADLTRHKGWVGNLIEQALGAEAGSKAEQDFIKLGIELKTLPINTLGEPLETTFVSLAPLTQTIGVSWETSHVRHKLSKVLWVLIEGDRKIPLAERRVGQSILWQPSIVELQQLQKDWEELMEYITLGRVHKINASIGEVLQLRPKGANSLSQTQGINQLGQLISTKPLGFYLRKNFTQAIIQSFLNHSN